MARDVAVEGRLAHRQPRRRRARTTRCMSKRPTAIWWRSTTATGREKWRTEICDLEQFYYASAAPLIVKNHVIVGVSGDDLDIPGLHRGARSGNRRAAVALVRYPEPGSPEAKTWPSVEAMMHGGGMTWGSTTYDPELNLIYFGTGNPQPVINGRKRQGDNLYHRVDRRAESRHRQAGLVFPVVAARHARLGRDADAGALRRQDQRHSRASCWRRRRATAGSSCSTATTGRNISQHGVREDQLDEGPRREGPADPESREGAAGRRRAGVAEPGRRAELAAAELQPAAPDSSTRTRRAASACTTSTRTKNDEKPQGWGGNDRGGWSEAMLQAIDYKTGKIAWRHKWDGARACARAC